MLDGCGRTIDYLRLSVTDLCNYRCRYCMPPEGVAKRDHGDILSLEELADIARAAVRLGVKKFASLAESLWSAGGSWSCAASCGPFRAFRSCVLPPTAPCFPNWLLPCGRPVWTG